MKGIIPLITPLESALTSTAGNKGLITPLESALAEKWGVGVILPSPVLTTRHSSLPTMFKSFLFRLFHTLLHFFAHIKNSTLLFSCSSELSAKNTRGWGRAAMAYLKKNFKSLSSRMHNLPKTPAKGTPEAYLPFRLPIGGHKNFSIDLSRPCREDPGPVGTGHREPSAVRLLPHRLVDRRAFAGHNFHSAPLLGVATISEEGE